MSVEAAHGTFWELAEDWLAIEGVEKATMMGFPCLRWQGAFFASVEHKGDGLVIKVDRKRVEGLIAEGLGEAFAPNGRVFKEWVRIPFARSETWEDRIGEAFAFAGGVR